MIVFRLYSHVLGFSRDELRAHEARRWLGVAGPKLSDLKRAEVCRAIASQYLLLEQEMSGRLFPPPPEPILASPADWSGP